MRKRLGRKKRGKKNVANMEEIRPTVTLRKKTGKTHSAFYNAGPMLAIPNLSDGQTGSKGNSDNQASQRAESEPVLELSPVSGKGSPSTDSAKGSNVTIEGRTDAHFDGGSFDTQNVRVTAAQGCDSCTDGDPCIRARGVLLARFHVRTSVTLPSVSEFPDLTPCQQARVQNAIDTVLAPHEQDHVRAFRQYNGVTRTPFDVTLCRSDFNSTIQSMFDRQESSRQAAAQAASDALDPFNFTVDIDCEEPPDENTAPAEEEKTPQSKVEPNIPDETKTEQSATNT